MRRLLTVLAGALLVVGGVAALLLVFTARDGAQVNGCLLYTSPSPRDRS